MLTTFGQKLMIDEVELFSDMCSSTGFLRFRNGNTSLISEKVLSKSRFTFELGKFYLFWEIFSGHPNFLMLFFPDFCLTFYS